LFYILGLLLSWSAKSNILKYTYVHIYSRYFLWLCTYIFVKTRTIYTTYELSIYCKHHSLTINTYIKHYHFFVVSIKSHI
jgi:hypothetical protein